MCSWYVTHLTQLVNLLFSGDMLGLGFGIKNCASFLVASVFGLSFVFDAQDLNKETTHRIASS